MNEIVLHESSPQDDSRQYFHIDEMENSSRVKSYNLSGVCPEGFVESIVASPGTIESSEMQDTPAVLSSWHKSLSSGGKLKLYFMDSKNTFTEYVYNRMPISDLNSTVFLSGSKSLHDMFEVRNALISIGFKIEKQGYLSHDHRIGFVHASKK
jgi:hypothetical protein|tara:strand:+ start:719 stop:1177 length:459 start_codon:yes stop_codon:yes gene_type:complete